ncbi:MAG: cell division inhibitor SulA [Enterobacteriaceae bacterium]|jgi:cell division inhibitor SulA|nr:cell division inhibitor SulA [Enterobacteriaceae bacterium]
MNSIQHTHTNIPHTAVNNVNRHLVQAQQTNLVSEIVYDPQNPFTLHLLLPFLQQLGQQRRWQLWLSPERRLNRYRIDSLGLPAEKTVSLNISSVDTTVKMMEKALRSGNFSSVTAWLPSIDQDTKERLAQAAINGDCYCFILQPLSAIQNHSQQYDMFSRTHWH